MSDRDLADLAAAAGLATEWTDYRGERHSVAPDVLHDVLQAMDIPSRSERAIAESRRGLEAGSGALDRPLRTVDVDGSIDIRTQASRGQWISEDGSRADARGQRSSGGEARFTAPREPGYYRLEAGNRSQRIAVAPRRCWGITDIASDRKLWGVAAQIYGLRDGQTRGFGDFAALGRFAQKVAAAGAAAVAVSPTHALFAAVPGRYGPYAPSSRLFLNVLYGDAAGEAGDRSGDDADLVDWPAAGARRLEDLRLAYARFRDNPQADAAAFQRFVCEGGAPLLAHARFEALDARFRARGFHDWRRWPDGFTDGSNADAADLAPDRPEVELHLYLQFLADRALGSAQQKARSAGMDIGLIADLAVGMDAAGSHAWSAPRDILAGVSVGAPPDLLRHTGQYWGLTAFSPHGLVRSGYDGFLSTLRVAMRNAGGVRIDHAMGLQRLWVVPEGADASTGTYLSYPSRDLVRLTALESWRHRAIVIAEDLGTVPEGFRETIARAGIHGMRVLWFERTKSNRFKAPSTWDADTVAMSTTHDLPTLAGWWKGRDIAWRLEIDGDAARAEVERSARDKDRANLWWAMRRAGCAEGSEPAHVQVQPVVSGGVTFVGSTASRLAIVPIEDLLAIEESPNLPGTVDEHPNWRRRLPDTASLDDAVARHRMTLLSRARSTS